jgi:hypothetical protein
MRQATELTRDETAGANALAASKVQGKKILTLLWMVHILARSEAAFLV